MKQEVPLPEKRNFLHTKPLGEYTLQKQLSNLIHFLANITNIIKLIQHSTHTIFILKFKLLNFTNLYLFPLKTS